jgi:antitoxin HigA-1
VFDLEAVGVFEIDGNGRLRTHPPWRDSPDGIPRADGISQYRIAKVIDVPPRRINEIVHRKRGISADTALRLSRVLGLSDMFFINMQAHYDAEVAREQLAAKLAGIDRIA